MERKILLYEKRKILSLIGICICMIFIFALCSNNNGDITNNTSSIAKVNTNNQSGYLTSSNYDTNSYIYLSDIPYDKSQSRPGWGSIHINETESGVDFSIKVEGAFYNFNKGIWAHASSCMVYDLTNYQGYDYFTSYTGVNSTSGGKGNGVKFYIYTSTDGKNWDLKTDANPSAVKSTDNATFVKIDIKGAKFLKLIANDNGANGNDHSVYVEPKLIKESYKEPGEDLVPSIVELDKEIKTKFANSQLTNQEYELALLKRELIDRVGNYALKRFLSESDANKETYIWLTNNLDILRLYILGGTPDGGNYYNSLTQLSRLYNEYSSDFTNKSLLNNKWYPNMTYGDLYKKMAITLSLTHSQNVALWMQPSSKENQSDALRRYAIFKYLHKNGKLRATESVDITPWFEALQVEEMRFVMNNAIDDEEILWLNDYVQSNINKYPNQVWRYLTPHPYMAYVWPNYGNSIYYDDANKDYFNELFAINGTGLFDLKYTIPGGKNTKSYTLSITRGTNDYKLYKVWMNIRNKFGTGAVCGGISKTGSNIRTTHGIPATVIGQPGHAALLYYTKDANGKGYWGIDNDVSGWTLSEKGERLLLNWGNANTNYARGSYQVVYMALSQEAINDYENLVKAEEQVMLAKVYDGDLTRQEQIYRKALEIQPINVDAWLGLINVYLANSNKTENEFYDLAKELAEDLKYYPLPMYQLTNLIKPKITSVENSYRFTLLQTRILTEASVTPNNTAENYYVYQPSLTRLEANFLLGKIDKTIATFSFDGDDAGKIVLSSRFDNTGVRWDYSIDGKKTWNEVSFTAEEVHKLKLTDKQIASITSENDIYVHIVGVNYDDENLYKIDITEQSLPNTLYANDLENRVVGVTEIMQWRLSENDKWTSYKDSSPDLTGDKTVQVRVAATGTKLTSDYETYTFTKDNQPDTRKYIPVSHLSIHSVSTEATSNGGQATNSIDGNYNTRWHSAWNGTDTNRYIVVKLDKPVSLSAVEFVPAGGGNGKIYDGTIYGSMDGENWEELTSLKNLTYTNQANTIEDAIANTKSFEIDEPKEVQYVKIVANRTNGNWFTARAFNFYQDLTKNPHPTAGVAYGTTNPTNNDVIARLVNPSTQIKITNNNGSDTYIFKENGSFVFEFIDEKTGEKGSSKATVSWIDKIAPTATIEYNITSKTSNEVLAKLIPSEEVTVLNNGKVTTDDDGNVQVASDPFVYTFTQNGEFTFEFTDAAGNKSTATAKVDWIIKEPVIDQKPNEDTDNSAGTNTDNNTNNGSESKPSTGTDTGNNTNNNAGTNAGNKPNSGSSISSNTSVNVSGNKNSGTTVDINDNKNIDPTTSINEDKDEDTNVIEDKNDKITSDTVDKSDTTLEEKKNNNKLYFIIGCIITLIVLAIIILIVRRKENKRMIR